MNNTQKSKKEKLSVMRHSCAHILAAAVRKLYPGVKFGIGPVIENGFYYDFEFKKPISEADLEKISSLMARIIKLSLPIKGEQISIQKAKSLFKNQPYKLELIEELASKNLPKKGAAAPKIGRNFKVSIYKVGGFTDLCKGPHVKSTADIGHFKLLKVAGAYWRGDEKNPMLTRIYGTCFPTKKELDNYLWQIEEAKKRDHRRLGKTLDLFSISPLTGPGLILWHPKLAIVRNIAEQFWKEEHYKNGYQFVYTPHIASMDMFVISRHYSKYINFMFPAMLHQYIEGESAPDYSTDEQLKPMNCPNHIQIYKSKPRSYRELPIRMAELGTVYRYERAGTLHGMIRVRGFTQDDSHIFCRPDQVIDEVRRVIRLTKYIYEVFGFKDYQAYLATRPEKYLGTLKIWDFAQESLKKALEAEGVDFRIDEGQGVFYGPKIDSKIKDSLGREWQLGTIQVDFNLPSRAETTQKEIDEFWVLKTFKDKFKTKEKLANYLKKLGRGFDIQFINKHGKEEQAVMIHRTIYGSMERFFGILIEHYAGAFPTWLAPVQVTIIPIAERHLNYAREIQQILLEQNIRTELDERNETMQAKVRDATLQKIPFMIIIGEKEIRNLSEWFVSVRTREGEDKGQKTLAQFLAKIKEKIEKKA